MTVGRALSFSAAFHVIVLFVAPSAWFPRLPAMQRFEVAYVPPPSVKAAPPKPAPAATRIPEPAAPGRDLPPTGSMSEPMPATSPARAEEPLASPVPRPAAREDKPAPFFAPHPVISSVPEKGFVFLDHKEEIRKHLKARLHYPSFLSDGLVRLRLVLTPDGLLKQVIVVEASDSRLAEIAAGDAQAASPYPKLPPKYTPKQLRYEFQVRYKPE